MLWVVPLTQYFMRDCYYVPIINSRHCVYSKSPRDIVIVELSTTASSALMCWLR